MKKARINFSQVHFIVKKWTHPTVLGSGPISNYIRKNSKTLRRMYKSPLLTTVNPTFAFWFRTKYEKCSGLTFERVFMDLPDGGRLGLDKVSLNSKIYELPSAKQPIVLLFPGGNETTYATKIQTMCRQYLASGYGDVFVCNYRGKCNTPLRTPQLSFPFLHFNDVAAVVKFIEHKFPDRPILLTGDCFGANMVVDYIASEPCKYNSSIVGAVVHSIVWNSELSTSKLYQDPHFSLFIKPWATMIQKLLLYGKIESENVMASVSSKIGKDNFEVVRKLKIESPKDVAKLYKYGLFKFWDDIFTSKEEYMKEASSHNKVGSLNRPIVLINAADDPTAPVSLEDVDNFDKDPNLCFWFFGTGGHCGYVRTMFPTCTNYIDEVVVECAQLLVQFHEEQQSDA